MGKKTIPFRARGRWWRMAGFAGLLAGIGLLVTPLPEALKRPPAKSVEFVDRSGISLRRMLVEQTRYASSCTLEEVSPHVIAATLSAEDKRFWWHPGVDPAAVLRALLRGGLAGGGRSGASTISQQLIKTARPGERTVWRKLEEAWLALRVELFWSKRRILSEYLNRLDYGNLQMGIASASRHYFSKPPSDLSPAESALLAALPKAPSRLNPRQHLEAARARQRWVLNQMRANGWLSPDAWERALVEPIQLAAVDHEFRAPLFVNRLLSRAGTLPAEGGVVRTTVDLALDRRVREALSDNLARLALPGVAAAAVVLDNATGDVLAMAGAHTEMRAGAPQVDGAWASRSPGSALKPFTYALALEAGMHPCSVLADVPSAFATPTGLYRPQNYNLHFFGPVTLRFALGNSLNVPAVRLLERLGGAAPLHALMLRLGVSSFAYGPDYYGLGLTLGNGEMRLLELANAYAALARLGEFQPYRFLVREKAVAPTRTRVFSKETAFLIADMLADNPARAVAFGLDSQLHFDFPVACKTGTSSDYRDNWTLGFTPEFTVGVWVGRPDGAGMQGVSGVSGAAPVFHAVMEHLHSTRGTTWFEQPASVRPFFVDPRTGRSVPPGCTHGVWEKCASEPEAPRSADYDALGRVRLPGEYGEWLASRMNPRGAEWAPAEHGDGLCVLEPLEGTVLFLDPDIPVRSQTLALRAAGAGVSEQVWDCATAPVVVREGGARLELRAGVHVVRVRDSRTQREAQTWVEVRPL